MKTPRSLYVHVPFCARRCSYCDFAVEAVREPPVDRWIAAVGTELKMVREDQGWDEPLQLDTLYVGGGTPSLLGTGAMAALLEVLAPNAQLASGAEWTCEANPESFTTALARDWSAAGVNRLSMGAQTFHQESLRWMGRLHGPDGPARAVEAARSAGITDISIDLIFGLPAHLGRDWRSDLDEVLELQPEHVSLYGLTAEAGAPLGRWVAEGREKMPDEDSYADDFLIAHGALASAGFEHYEVSNFARPGRRSRHNSAYWNGEPYAALGPGAHAFYSGTRRWNLRSWSAYADEVERARLPIADEEIIDAETARLEAIWLGLRTDQGIRVNGLSAAGRALVVHWVEQGWAEAVGDRIVLRAAGWLVMDALAVSLADAESAPRPRRARIDAEGSLVQIAPTLNP